MTNSFHYPSPMLADFVSSYLIAEDTCSALNPGQVVWVYPNGLNSLGFTFGDCTQHRNSEGVINRINWGCFVTGTQEKAFQMLSTPNLKQFVIIFKPGILSKLLRSDLAAIRNHIFEADNYVPESHQICEELATAQTSAQKIEVIENWIIHRLKPEYAANEVTQDIIRLINKQAGDVKITDICRSYKINKRYLERKFSELIGISPKKYADIIRFNNLLNIISGSQSKSWTEVYGEAGFNDYSHLRKQVFKLADMHPRLLKEKLTDKDSKLFSEKVNEPFNRINMLQVVEGRN